MAGVETRQRLGYLLDTDTFSAIAKRSSASAVQRFQQLLPGQGLVSVVTLGEVAFGMCLHPVHERMRAHIEALRQVVSRLPMDERVVPHYAMLRAKLQKAGTPIGPNDLWIAAHALAEDLTLVSGNVREFKRVEGLRVENWLR